jgi:hypothetical protein
MDSYGRVLKITEEIMVDEAEFMCLMRIIGLKI